MTHTWLVLDLRSGPPLRIPVESSEAADRFQAAIFDATLAGTDEPIPIRCAAGGDPIPFSPGEIVLVRRTVLRDRGAPKRESPA